VYICGAPDHTYGPACLPAELTQEPYRDAATIDPARFGIRAVAPVFATVRYRWDLTESTFIENDLFTEGLRTFYHDVAQKTSPASVLLEISGATLAQNMIYCSDGTERRVLYETSRPNDRAATAIVTDNQIAGADRSRFADDSWDCFFLGSAGSFNYGHWLVDDLPRLKAALMLTRRSKRPLRIVLPSYGTDIDNVRIESVRLLLGEAVHIDLIDPASAQYFPRVYYTTPVTDHPLSKSPIAMEFAARQSVSALLNGASVERDGRAERIFVGRRNSYGRNLLNMDALRQRLGEMSFRYVDGEALSFADQVEIFSQATVVVGLMGAAMTNTLFCRPTTPVIHLAPRGWIEPFYFDLAQVRGHRYHALFGATDDTGRPPHARDFAIDIERITRFIEAL
jgi:hypothetical protein